MPRTRKTTVSRETKSASPPSEEAGIGSTTATPQEKELAALAEIAAKPSSIITAHQCYALIMFVLEAEGINVTLLRHEESIKALWDAIDSLKKPAGGYSLEQWIRDYKIWRDTIIGFALDDANASVESNR